MHQAKMELEFSFEEVGFSLIPDDGSPYLK
jgi:hypothetical protein